METTPWPKESSELSASESITRRPSWNPSESRSPSMLRSWSKGSTKWTPSAHRRWRVLCSTSSTRPSPTWRVNIMRRGRISNLDNLQLLSHSRGPSNFSNQWRGMMHLRRRRIKWNCQLKTPFMNEWSQKMNKRVLNNKYKHTVRDIDPGRCRRRARSRSTYIISPGRSTALYPSQSLSTNRKKSQKLSKCKINAWKSCSYNISL